MADDVQGSAPSTVSSSGPLPMPTALTPRWNGTLISVRPLKRRIADRSATATGTLCGGLMGRWGALAAIRALVTAVDDLVVRRALVETR